MFFITNLIAYIFMEGHSIYPEGIGKNYIFLENIQDIVNIYGARYQYYNKTNREQIQVLFAGYPGMEHHFVDLYNTLKMNIKFSSHLIISRDADSNVFYGNSDIALVRATFISSPITLHPVYSVYDQIWVKGDIYQGSSTYFLEAFDFNLWLAFLLIFIICVIVILLIRKIISRSVTPFDAISLTLNQGVEQSPVPSNLLSFKIVLFSLSLMLIVFHSGFGAFMSSLLAINKSALPFNDFNSMLEQNEYMLCLRYHSAAHRIVQFEKQHNPNFKVNVNGKTCPSIFRTTDYREYKLDDPIKAQCQHEKVIFMSSGKVKHFRLLQCGISPIKGRYINQQSSLIVNPGFKYKEQFNKALIRLRTAGVIQNMQLRDTMAMNKEYGFENPHHLDNSISPITYHHIHLIVIGFFVFGCFLSLLILLGEIIIKHWSK